MTRLREAIAGLLADPALRKRLGVAPGRTSPASSRGSRSWPSRSGCTCRRSRDRPGRRRPGPALRGWRLRAGRPTGRGGEEVGRKRHLEAALAEEGGELLEARAHLGIGVVPAGRTQEGEVGGHRRPGGRGLEEPRRRQRARSPGRRGRSRRGRRRGAPRRRRCGRRRRRCRAPGPARGCRCAGSSRSSACSRRSRSRPPGGSPSRRSGCRWRTARGRRRPPRPSPRTSRPACAPGPPGWRWRPGA